MAIKDIFCIITSVTKCISNVREWTQKGNKTMIKADRIWILTGSAIRAVDERLIGTSRLRSVSWTVCQWIVIGNLANVWSVLLVVVVIVIRHLLIVAGRHLLWWMACVSFCSIVGALAHAILLIIVHSVSINTISVRSWTGSGIILILIIVFLLQLLLDLRWGWDSASGNRSAVHHIVAHQLRRTVTVRVRVVVVTVIWRLMVLRIVINQVGLLCRCGHDLLFASIVVHVVCSIDRRVRWRCGRRRLLQSRRYRLIVRQRFGG